MAEANISKEVWVEDLEKLPDGSFKKKNHIAKAKNGTTFDEHLAEKASLTKEGHIKLSSAVNSTSETLGATLKAVKIAYDRADAAFQSASNGKTLISSAITGVDDAVVIPTSPSFGDLASAIGGISTGMVSEITPGDFIVFNNNITKRGGSESKDIYHKILEYEVLVNGFYRVGFEARHATNSTDISRVRIYKNNSPYGTVRIPPGGGQYVDFRKYSQDLKFTKGDLLQVYYLITYNSYGSELEVKDLSLGISFPKVV